MSNFCFLGRPLLFALNNVDGDVMGCTQEPVGGNCGFCLFANLLQIDSVLTVCCKWINHLDKVTKNIIISIIIAISNAVAKSLLSVFCEAISNHQSILFIPKCSPHPRWLPQSVLIQQKACTCEMSTSPKNVSLVCGIHIYT